MFKNHESYGVVTLRVCVCMLLCSMFGDFVMKHLDSTQISQLLKVGVF